MHCAHAKSRALDQRQRIAIQMTAACDRFPRGRQRVLHTANHAMVDAHVLHQPQRAPFFQYAFRFAFALATLPQERGSAPSFIFLDEPLGSFDSERADALIYLLTEGEIARAFDQIFLISHVHVDERLFTNRVVMENGHVAFTDLKGER